MVFNMKTHLKIHIGIKPYVCKYPGCVKKFVQSSNLNAHSKVHVKRDAKLKLQEELNDDENIDEDKLAESNGGSKNVG